MFIILLGAPGAGKGTQAKTISEKLNVPHISTGELFRNEMSQGSELGKRIKETMNSGNLVDDATTLEIFKKRLEQKDCERGALLDGIPRNIKQAKLLSKLFEGLEKKIDHVLYISLPENEIINRISGRRTCKTCGASYHIVYNPPKIHNICDIDGGPLYQREDQKPQAIKTRLENYHAQTKPLIKFYDDLGLITEIDGQSSIDNVSSDIFNKLGL